MILGLQGSFLTHIKRGPGGAAHAWEDESTLHRPLAKLACFAYDAESPPSWRLMEPLDCLSQPWLRDMFTRAPEYRRKAPVSEVGWERTSVRALQISDGLLHRLGVRGAAALALPQEGSGEVAPVRRGDYLTDSGHLICKDEMSRGYALAGDHEPVSKPVADDDLLGAADLH